MMTCRINAGKVPLILSSVLVDITLKTNWTWEENPLYPLDRRIMAHSRFRGDGKNKIPAPIGNGIRPVANHRAMSIFSIFHLLCKINVKTIFILKSIIFWDVTPCNLLSCDMFFRNVGCNLTDYAASHPRNDTLHNHRCENLKSNIYIPSHPM
jgi:hypothetical protein